MARLVWSGIRIDPDAAWHYAQLKRRPDTSTVQGTYEVKDEWYSILGMMAFAVWLGKPLELLTPDEPSDFGEDFRVLGWKVDIKATIYATGKLVYRWGTRHRSDVYVLTVVDPVCPSRTRCVGWAWHAELMNGDVVDWGNRGKPARVLSQERLHPMASLRHELGIEAALAA